MDTNYPITNTLPFSTESGNKYIYDNFSGLTFPQEPTVLKKLTEDYLSIDRTSASLPNKIACTIPTLSPVTLGVTATHFGSLSIWSAIRRVMRARCG